MTKATAKRAKLRISVDLGKDLIGVVAVGTRVLGRAGANYELDLVVGVARSRLQAVEFQVDGIEIGPCLKPLFQLRLEFAEEQLAGLSSTLGMFRSGEILLDNLNEKARLKVEAT